MSHDGCNQVSLMHHLYEEAVGMKAERWRQSGVPHIPHIPWNKERGAEYSGLMWTGPKGSKLHLTSSNQTVHQRGTSTVVASTVWVAGGGTDHRSL